MNDLNLTKCPKEGDQGPSPPPTPTMYAYRVSEKEEAGYGDAPDLKIVTNNPEKLSDTGAYREIQRFWSDKGSKLEIKKNTEHK